jgi:uncharacterized protein (DUF779 family)
MFGNENEPKILSESDIMELKKKHGIILFYMNGCGHCDVMKPAWNKIINELKDKHKNEIILGAIESSSMHIFNKHGIYLGALHTFNSFVDMNGIYNNCNSSGSKSEL